MVRIKLVLIGCLLSLGVSSSVVLAQTVRIEAVPGIPFGVGRVVMPVSQYIDSEQLDTRHMSVSDKNGRVLYPAVRYTQPLGLIREILGVSDQGAPSELHFHFLFTGAEPLLLTLNTPTPQTLRVVPNTRPVAYKRLLRAWWVRYKAAARKQRQEGDYPPLVETYLTSMLSRRLGLTNISSNRRYETGESLSMLLGTEDLRLAMMQDAVNDRTVRNQPIEFPLPEGIAWPDSSIPQVADVHIEPIANYVPHECFYIRFAQFPNYLWLRRLLEEYGGDLSRMVTLRGTDAQLNERVIHQLGLRETSLSRILGPQVISDMAMIGRDTFLREGAAIGILFEAKNKLLGPELEGQRHRSVAELKELEAKVETVVVEGTEVSLASTPDNRLRSFYVSSENYHLVTNCREIARRFIQCAHGQRTLANSPEFRYARSLIPLGDDNTLFVYLSRKFFEGLLSPRYQVELARRLQVLTDFELIELATLAAAAEGYGNEPLTTSRLVELGFLGSEVDRRTDGSRTEIFDRRRVDSRRGGRGTFLPIPDTPVSGVTRSEAEKFQRTVDFHRRSWRQMDPVLLGLRRTALDEQTERVQIDARMLPLNTDQYRMFLDMFGPPNTTRIRPLEDDIVSVQAFVDGGDLAIPPHHLYFGIRDAGPQRSYSERRFLKSLQVLRTAPAYLAAWPSPGMFDRFGLGGKPLGNGYHKMLLGLFRLEALNGFSLLSFDPKILSEVAPQLQIEEVDTAAQLRIRIGDIKNSKFGEWANDLDFQRAWETSVGNVHLLHQVSQQLRVPLPESKQVAERILDAKLFCPMGGEYQLIQDQDGSQRWASTVWMAGKQQARDNYVSPLMTWLRGFEAEVTIEENRVVAKGFLDIQRDQQNEGGFKLPLFDFLKGE